MQRQVFGVFVIIYGEFREGIVFVHSDTAPQPCTLMTFGESREGKVLAHSDTAPSIINFFQNNDTFFRIFRAL